MAWRLIDILHAILFGIVEGVTEWLPISSTGHLILVDEWIQLNISTEFKELYFVVIQLGAIMAVVVLFWKKLFPITNENGLQVKKPILVLWLKVIVACIPAGIYAITLDNTLHEVFYNYQTVAVMLILLGILFLLIEYVNASKEPKIVEIANITYTAAFIIGIAQLMAAIFPGTSRSGATILCGLLLGLSRSTAADFSFVLAIPAMFGASLLKLLKLGFVFSSSEILILLIGTLTAFLVSMVSIKFLRGYIKKHDFKVFGWYRIVLGGLVMLSFL
ncbi:MAG: undecaprenyl-diphosphate phosphatase [Anaerolineaceae bacterium]|nr:undecaprenyl-diphosphate phosphatase [Anaerolineaceae bacterium]